MPELPEVETTRCGLAPHCEGHAILAVIARERRLRWPVDDAVLREPLGQNILRLERRGKYLLFRLQHGALIWHLGMSGSLRVIPAETPSTRHDHVDLVLDTGQSVRLRDPRRFGAILWTAGDPLQHPLLATLGAEPLSASLDAGQLRTALASRSPLKTLLLDSRRICGIGNIYASETLFQAGLSPLQPGDTLQPEQAERLLAALRDVLQRAIEAGGSSLRDFVAPDISNRNTLFMVAPDNLVRAAAHQSHRPVWRSAARSSARSVKKADDNPAQLKYIATLLRCVMDCGDPTCRTPI